MTRPRPSGAASAGALVGWALTCAMVGGFTTRTVAAILACAGMAAWAGLFLWPRDQRRRRDRDAYEHLQLLRDRTCQPAVRLLAVIGTDWANPAGQAAVTVEVNTGSVGKEWFAMAQFPHGSMVLLSSKGEARLLLDWMPPSEVQAAHRHRVSQARSSSCAHRPRVRRRRRAFIAEVEALLRKADNDGTPEAANPTHREHNPREGTP